MKSKALLFIAAGSLLSAWCFAQADPADDAILKRYTPFVACSEWRAKVYQAKQFDAAEKYLTGLSQEGNDAARLRRDQCYAALTVPLSDIPASQMTAVLNQWVKERPASYLPRLLRGGFYKNYAWDGRGTAFSRDVQQDQWRKFGDRLRLAQTDLTQAQQLNPNDPTASVFLLQIAMGIGLPRKEIDRLFANAISIEPGHYWAYSIRLIAATPHWGGSNAEMMAFAEQIKQKSVTYPRLGTVWAKSQKELYWRSKDKASTIQNPFENPVIWNEIQDIYTRLIAADPDNWERRANYAALTLAAKRYSAAAEQFDAMADRYPALSDFDTLEDFNGARARSYMEVGWQYHQQKNYEQAKYWYKRAIALGSDPAMNNFGWMYQHGEGVPQDNLSAAKWYRMAVAKGNKRALVNLENLLKQ